MPQQDAGERDEASPSRRVQRFIPYRRSDLAGMLATDGRLDTGEQERFGAFVRLLNAVFHHDFHARLEALKDAYAPFDPDPDTRVVRDLGAADRDAARRQLRDGLKDLLDHGNFEPISAADLRRAFEEESLLSLRLEVDQDDFEDVLFFRRGITHREQERTSLFGLRRRTVAFANYEKVLMLVTFKGAEHFDEDAEDLPFAPGSTILKLFSDVPRADIEMLFPNAQPRMRLLDKLLIGVPALVSGIVVLSTKLVATLGLLLLLLGFWLGIRDEPVALDQATLVTLGAGLASVGGYLVRQFTKFKSRKLEFMKKLSENLYFRNLDNDVGVLHHLVDDAEEEEVKEALLAWYFLHVADGPLTVQELDTAVEEWFRDRWDTQLDFEVNDGLGKLRRLRLVEEVDGDRLAAVPLAEALARLDERWDHYFEYDHAPSAGGGARGAAR